MHVWGRVSDPSRRGEAPQHQAGKLVDLTENDFEQAVGTTYNAIPNDFTWQCR